MSRIAYGVFALRLSRGTPTSLLDVTWYAMPPVQSYPLARSSNLWAQPRIIGAVIHVVRRVRNAHPLVLDGRGHVAVQIRRVHRGGRIQVGSDADLADTVSSCTLVTAPELNMRYWKAPSSTSDDV